MKPVAFCAFVGLPWSARLVVARRARVSKSSLVTLLCFKRSVIVFNDIVIILIMILMIIIFRVPTMTAPSDCF